MATALEPMVQEIEMLVQISIKNGGGVSSLTPSPAGLLLTHLSSCWQKMASENRGRSNGTPSNGANVRWGARRNRTKIVMNVEALATAFASREELRRATEEYMAVSTREIELLRRNNRRLEEQVASLQHQLAAPAKPQGGSSAAPGGENKPL